MKCTVTFNRMGDLKSWQCVDRLHENKAKQTPELSFSRHRRLLPPQYYEDLILLTA